ncbi:ABC transporter permease [Rhizobium sp. CSW-27]|uniref:ABC transporter permease n=1 Tax=Rhizobium sp. CSW-27 TaxID=2839985 RepID=UPI001C01ADAC|nr:ABC transporter permease [Rhizobium sp. CSW-27]MBT9369953.1 ABC transporter permease [Rhizobium sp. CSW-27]
MLRFILQRLLWVPPTLIAISVVAFAIINLPPGDYVDRYALQAAAQGDVMTEAQKEALRITYGLDAPIPVQYVRWMSDMLLHGNFGWSFQHSRPVAEVIGERLGLTAILSIVTLTVTWMIAIPIGIYSAVRRYSIADYVFTSLGFFGLALPNFLLALALMYALFVFTGQSVGGLFSSQYADAPWSLGKVLDLLAHLWIPILVLGISGMASIIRTIRANLLDELRAPYLSAARAKGLPETWALLKYPVRHAMNPFVSGLNDVFVHIISGETIVAIVLGLETTGPLLFDALRNQDMFLAATLIMFLGILGMIGTLFSDVLLAWLDPRIRRQFTLVERRA